MFLRAQNWCDEALGHRECISGLAW